MHVLKVHDFLNIVNRQLQKITSVDFLIEGEVYDHKISQNRHSYFCLKDQETGEILNCVLFNFKSRFPLENGLQVRIHGLPEVYKPFGKFQVNVDYVDLVGEGILQKNYELLKKKLEAEGLFDPDRKRPLPRFPKKIGLITSRDAAAYGDFLRILNNRWGGVCVEHAHVQVQGREAVPSILGAFQYFNDLDKKERPDVLVLTRGGGGLEDLHAFNDESVARAVFSSVIPVVCAVGHERDESLADFVADVRASTPSNAAERVVPERSEVMYEIEMMAGRMDDQLLGRIRVYETKLDLSIRNLLHFFERKSGEVRQVVSSLLVHSNAWLSHLYERLDSRVRLIKSLDPKRVLERGYSLVTSKGKVVKKASQLDAGARIKVQFAQGSADAKVEEIISH